MKKLALGCTLAFSFAAGTFAQTGTSPAPAPESTKAVKKEEVPSSDSPLVRAAKTTRAKNEKKTSKLIINNDDVKKSKGKLIYITEKPIQTPATPPQPTAAPTKASSVALEEATKKLDAARKEVAELEKELARLEDDYYDEDNATYRDEVISARFTQAKTQLDKARQKVLDARSEQQRLEPAASESTP